MLFREFDDAYLALEQLETRATPSAHMAQFILLSSIGNQCRSISTAYDDCRSVLDCLDAGVEQRVGPLGESREFEDSGRTVPKDRLGLCDGLRKYFIRFRSAVETLPIRGDTGLMGCLASLVEIVR